MGGFGAVYRAHDPQLQRTVALKLLQTTGDEQRDQHRINRFLVEGRAGARLRHPNIVPVFDAGRDEESGEYYLAAAFITGEPLSAAVDGKPLELRRAATIVSQLASALDYAHGQGILHRDVKPDNVMLDAQGTPHLMDFGLARIEESESHLTRDGAVMGTPAYMSPEQCVGKQDALGPAADQYSLGCLFYELLTGEKLFDGPVPVQIHHQINTEAPPPSGKNPAVPRDLDTICLKSLSKEPSRRYGNCAELAADLERWLADEPIQARQLTMWERLHRWRRRNPAIAGLMLTTATLLLLVALISTIAVVRLNSLANAERQAKDAAILAEEESRKQTAEAEQARQKANQKTKEVQETASKLEREVYKQRIARAHQVWLNNDVRQARQLLDECPIALRGWEWRYCRRLCQRGLFTFEGHKAEVAAAAFSPDGKWVASESDTGNLKLWNAQTGAEKINFSFPLAKKYRLRTKFVAFAPDGTKLAAACEDGVVRIWETNGGKEVVRLEGLGDFVSTLTFSPDGKRLAVGQAAISITGHAKPVVAKVWDLATKQPVFTLAGQTTNVTGLAFTQKSGQIITVDWTGKVQIWDAQTGTVQQTLGENFGNTRCLACSPDDRLLAIGGLDNKVRLWDIKACRMLATLMAHSGDVMCLDFSPDSKLLASASEDRSIRLWDTAKGEEVQALRGHSNWVSAVQFSSDNRRVVSASFDGTVIIWDTTRNQEYLKINYRGQGQIVQWVRTVKFSPDSRMISTGASSAQLYNIAQIPNPVRGFGINYPYCSDFSADGKLITIGGDSNVVKVWSVEDGKEVATFPATYPTHAIAISHDGNRLVWASQKEVLIGNVRTGRQERKYSQHKARVLCVALSPDGQTVASASDDGMVRMWNASSGEDVFFRAGPLPAGIWEIANAVGNDLAFSPDGSKLAIGGGAPGEPGIIEILDATSGKTVRKMHGHASTVDAVAFNRDATRLVSGSVDGTIKIWDPHLGEDLFTLQEDGGVISVDFSPDGQSVASAGIGESVKIWDAAPR